MRQVFFIIALAFLSACQQNASESAITRYACGAYAVEMDYAKNAGVVHGSSRSVALVQTISGSGARYAPIVQDEGEDALIFWTKGQAATLFIGETASEACVVNGE